MRADARANRDRLLAVAAEAVTEQGVEVPMREVARRAGVGLATLLRHFPTREALLEQLLRASFDELTARATEVEAADSAERALVLWLRDFVAMNARYRGAVASMMRAVADPDSALHDSCVTMRASGSRLLDNAQRAGVARSDLDGADVFALASALAWLRDQPGLADRAERHFEVVLDAVLEPRHTRSTTARGRGGGVRAGRGA